MIPTMMAALSSSTITPQTQTFNSSSTFTVPAHVAGSLTVEVFGAGGGGANTGNGFSGGNTEVDEPSTALIGQAVPGSGSDGPDGFAGVNGGVVGGSGYTILSQIVGGGSAGGGGAYNGGNGGYIMVNVDSGGVTVGTVLTVTIGIGGAAGDGLSSAGSNGKVVFAWNTES